MHSTNARHSCPFCDAPIDRLMCWKCSHGENARYRSVYELPPNSAGRRTTPTPKRPTVPPRPADRSAPKSIAELSQRPYFAAALAHLMARPEADARTAAIRLVLALDRETRST